jgi:indolepyruvate ferredoxin oxidoreductase, beta subunit
MNHGPGPKAITIAIVAMGGEGGGVLSDWIVELAEHNGYLAQTTSVPGVAQRTGSTIYYLELFPAEAARAVGRDPVLALMPVPGELDVVIASELMEAGRAIQRGFVTPDRTSLITSTHRVYSMTEKTAMGDGRVDTDALLSTCNSAAKTFIHGDYLRIAEDERSVISAAMFGALAGAETLPFVRQHFEDAIRKSGVGVDSSLAAFRKGFESARAPRSSEAVPANPTALTQPQSGPRLAGLIARIENEFPAAARDILIAGVQRLADYQDERYAADYLDLLVPIKNADYGTFAVLRETARYLALWMSYEDAIRVADLKIRRRRFQRVREEARVEASQLIQINEFLHPRVQEVADIMPRPLAKFLLNTKWLRGLAERLWRDGRVVQTTSLTGYLQLYAIASLRPWRRISLRFQTEREKIAAWMNFIPELITEDYALALEVAECPNLIKGYGDTHILGTRNFESLMEALLRLRRMPGAAANLKTLREAALADDTGQKLSRTLKEIV